MNRCSSIFIIIFMTTEKHKETQNLPFEGDDPPHARGAENACVKGRRQATNMTV
jgi:hypothetical protein